MGNAIGYQILFSATGFAAVYLLVRHGVGPIRRWIARVEESIDTVLNRQLLMGVNPRNVVYAALGTVAVCFIFGFAVANSPLGGIICAAVAIFLPLLMVKHLEQKRRQKLDLQLVDGLTTLASGVRAGLNLVQAIELLEQNHTAPIKQEFGQILREYQMGLDLNQAMRNASDRIGSPLYRLTFTAIEMHRLRGGDAGESMDRIAESIREIQRLEGKLDAITAQGRAQAVFMAVMPLVLLGILYFIMPNEVTMLFVTAAGRLLLLIAGVLIFVAFIWIRRIMSIDI